MEKKNTWLIVLIIILSLLVVGLSGFIAYDKLFSNRKAEENTKLNDKKNNSNIELNEEEKSKNNDKLNDEEKNNGSIELNDNTDNNTINNSDYSSEDLNLIGLNLYKLFTGNGWGPFKYDENNNVINYVDVITRMTQNYFDLPANDRGFSIPYREIEGGDWYTKGGWGTDKKSKFKSISIEKQEGNTVTFKVIYQYTRAGENPVEDSNTFVIKKVDEVWKVDRFELIHDLQF